MLYAPKIAFTLISIGQCNDARYHTEFSHQKCVIKSATSKMLLQAPKLYGLYHLDNELSKDQIHPCLTAIEVHKRLRHVSEKALRHLLKHSIILGIGLNSIGGKITCDVCIKSKITCKSLPKESDKWAKKLGEKVYSDIWGPSRHFTIDKKTYYVSFIDNYSRESVIYLMSSKYQVFEKYKLYKAMMLWQQDVCIKTLFSD